MIKQLSTKRQKGATLLELVMFIGLAALILIGGVVWYQTASEGQRISDEVSNLNAISALVRNTFTTQNNFEGLTNAVITRSSQFPDKMRLAGDVTRIKSGWADDGVDVASSSAVSPNDSFEVTYKEVPGDSCIDFTGRTYRFFERVQVNGNVVANIGDIAGNCDDANPNTIAFRAR